MYKLINIILFCFICCFLTLQAQTSESITPSLVINGINLVDGTVETSFSHLYTYEYKDKKVVRITENNPTHFESMEFAYFADRTEVMTNNQTKDIYHFDKEHTISKLEHYLLSSQKWNLYRSERLTWNKDLSPAIITRRVIEDAEGIAYLGYLSEFNSMGQMITETLVGNLSGNCQASLIFQKDGSLVDNGIESYTIHYTYDLENPELILTKTEDNGLITYFEYDSQTKKCVAKLRGNGSQLISRYFYEYDAQGFLSKTIVDDGQSFNKDDLTGVASRKIMEVQSSHTLSSYGQPLTVINKFYDLKSSQEVLLDKMVFTYSADGQLLKQDLFDANGDLKKSNADEQTHEINDSLAKEEYQLHEQRLISTDHYGNETYCFYDQLGRVIETRLPSILDTNDNAYQPTLKQTFNILDQVIQTQEQNGESTSYTYTIRNKPSLIEYSDGTTESYCYRLDGELEEQVARNGVRTLFSYDSLGRMIAKQIFSAGEVLLKELHYTYQGMLKASVTDDKSFTIYYDYDGAGRNTGYRYEDREGHVLQKTFAYDAIGQMFDPESDEIHAVNSSEVELDKQKDVEEIHTKEELILNERNQFVKVINKYLEDGSKYVTTYDALERPEHQVSYDAMGIKSSETDIRHDTNGHKILERHYKIFQNEVIGTYLITWKYDIQGHLIEICEGANTAYEKRTRYHYNQFGQLEKLVHPNGVCLNYRYNAQDLLTHMYSSDDSVDYTYAYDELLRLIEIYDKRTNHVQTFAYNHFNQLITVKNDEIALQYTYDDLGRKTCMILPDQTGIQYVYNNQDKLQVIERLDKDQNVIYSHQYTYEEETGRLIAENLIKNSGTLNYQFDTLGRQAGIKSAWWSQFIANQDRDRSGRILATHIIDPKGSYQQVFNYASNGQLSQENSNNYTSDSLFNRQSTDEQTWETNEINQLLTAADFQFVYDKNGNLTKKFHAQETHLYHYDALNRLIEYSKDQNHRIIYQYDAFNRRLAENLYSWQKDDNSWVLQDSYSYLYDGLSEIGKINAQGQMVELRVLGEENRAEAGAAVAIEIKDQLFVPIHDIFGSVRCLINTGDQSVSEFYRYSSFGEMTIYDAQGEQIDETAVGNFWCYFSKRYDPSTHLTFFGLRYYDASISRWITPDPSFFSDTPNLYAFVKNDPLNHYDLHGLFSISTLWNSGKQALLTCFSYLKSFDTKIKKRAKAAFELPPSVKNSFEKISQSLLCEWVSLLLGYVSSHSHNGVFGEREVDKIRITFINGILSTDDMLQENLDLISESHGGIKVHYVFRGTTGWIGDMSKAIVMRTCYVFGYRSIYAHHLAQTWRDLIEEMGGIDGGGMIIHYAHSLGGCDTDRARTLMTPEEQKMIRVFTFGSATLIRNEGFDNVINIVSANDGVSSILLEPLGRLRNYFDPNTNVRVYGTFSLTWLLRDHLLRGDTYRLILWQMGMDFKREFLEI